MPITEIAAQASQPRNSMAVGTALNQLERAEFIERNYAPGSRVYTTQLRRQVLSFEELPIDYGYLEEKRAWDERKLELMIKYAEHKGCRHHFVLAYFGDTHAARRCARVTIAWHMRSGTFACRQRRSGWCCRKF